MKVWRSMTPLQPYDWNSPQGLDRAGTGAGNRWLIDPVEGLSPEFARSYKYSKSFHTKDEAFCELDSVGVFGGAVLPLISLKVRPAELGARANP